MTRLRKGAGMLSPLLVPRSARSADRGAERPSETVDADVAEVLLASTVDVISIIDPRGALRYVSPSVTDALELAADELVGTSAVDLIHPDDRGELLAAAAELVRQPGAIARVRHRCGHRDGKWRVVESVARNSLEALR